MRGVDVSVIVPIKDRVPLLEATLRSVREQTVAVREIIVCDDGSDQDPTAIAERAGAIVLRRIGGGWGAGRARNAGLERAAGEYVWFLDADDLLLPDAVERLATALAPSMAPFAYGRAVVADRHPGGWRIEGGIATVPAEREDLLGSLYVRNTVPMSCALARTEAARAVGGFPRSSYSEDHRFWLSLGRVGRPIEISEIVGVHRSGGRHNSRSALEDDAVAAGEMALDLARPELRPARDAALLWAALSEARHSRRPGEALAAVRRLLIARPDRLRILSEVPAFIRHRRSARRAIERRSPELLEWLDGFS